MNYGRFFVLDYNPSRFNEGITVFNYRGLKDKKSDGIKTPKYPIYLIITKGSIDFKVHYFQEKDNLSNESVEKHLHTTILSLLLSANLEVKDGLTLALADAYQTNFPKRTDDGHNYLYNLMRGNEKREQSLSYSILSQFEIPKRIKIFRDRIKESKNENLTDQLEINYFIRKLILDFLFDLEHSKVFQNSPYYEHLSIKLRENYFFNALANKAMFYYYRELIEDTDKNSLEFYKEHLFKAEKEWTKSIRNEKSEIVFHESRKWSEETNNKKNNVWQNSNYKLVGWFKEPEDEMSEIYEERKGKEKEAYDLMLGKRKDKTTEHKIALERDIKNNYKLSSKWYTRKGAFSYIFSCSQNIFLCSIMLLSLIVALMDIFCGIGISIKLLFFPISFAALILCVWRFAHNRFFFGSHIYFPRLLIAIITGWVTIFFGTTMFSSLDEITNNPAIIGVAILLMLSAILWFIYIEIIRYNPHISGYDRSLRTLYLVLISFFYSYMTGFLLSLLSITKELFFDCNAISREISYLLSGNENIFIYPEDPLIFLLLVVFAMFIGVFLNMMIQEKRATESL